MSKGVGVAVTLPLSVVYHISVEPLSFSFTKLSHVFVPEAVTAGQLLYESIPGAAGVVLTVMVKL